MSESSIRRLDKNMSKENRKPLYVVVLKNIAKVIANRLALDLVDAGLKKIIGGKKNKDAN